MGGIRPLPAAGFQQPLGLGQRQQGLQEKRLRLPGHQAGPQLAQDGMIEARISTLQP